MARDPEKTRARILEVALGQFRERGYSKTTMRGIAKEAGLSLGAAYHYFEGKQDIVYAYYAQQQDAHDAAVGEALTEDLSLRERLGVVMHQALVTRTSDRRLMRELAPLVIGAEDKTNAFSARTERVREASLSLFRAALDDPAVPDDLREPAALSFWALQMGTMLYFAHDASPDQEKTRALVDGALDLSVMVLTMLGAPPFFAIRGQLNKVLTDAGLL